LFIHIYLLSIQLEFWDIDEEMSTAEEEHFMCNGVFWDPSGRMVATVVTQPMTGPVPVRNTLENGYNLWTFQGALVRKEQTQMFYQFQWRPRPASILSTEQQDKVLKKLKKSIQRFRDADSKRRQIKDAAANAERVGQLTVFRERMAKLHQSFETENARRFELGLSVPELDTDFEIVEETTEELIKETVEKYNP
jgi:translation initiation factor 3 subunit B